MSFDRRVFKAEVVKQLVLHNWSYRDLAEATGYTYKSMKTIINGERLTPRVAAKIAEVLGIEGYE